MIHLIYLKDLELLSPCQYLTLDPERGFALLQLLLICHDWCIANTMASTVMAMGLYPSLKWRNW